MIGRDEGDPLFLQIKEAQPSVLEPFTAPTEYATQGQRVVEGQRLTQAASDIFLGWLRGVGPDGKKRDFYVRQLWDRRARWRSSRCRRRGSPPTRRLCGGILARAHARTGDAIAIAGYLGGGDRFDEAIAELRRRLRRPERADYAAMKQAAGDGRIDVEEEGA